MSSVRECPAPASSVSSAPGIWSASQRVDSAGPVVSSSPCRLRVGRVGRGSEGPQALPASQLTSYHCNGRDALGNLLVPATKTPDAPVGTTGYQIRMCQLVHTGNPTTPDDKLVISGTGAYAGKTALQTP